MAMDTIKLNLGCGTKRLEGWINVDSMATFDPDVVWDLETFPWPWDDNSVDEILLAHVLEHLGEQRDVYLRIIQELYRICRHGAIIRILVPHPRHDTYLWDPTHVRPITVEGMQMFDQAQNRAWVANRNANTPLGIYLGVDLRMRSHQYVLDPLFSEKRQRNEVSSEELQVLLKTHNNVCMQINMECEVNKDPTR